MSRYLVGIVFACLTLVGSRALSCPRDAGLGVSKYASAVLDYISQASEYGLPTAAECASTAYLRIDIASLAQESTKRAAQLVQDSTHIQRRAAFFLSDGGDSAGSIRFLRQEVQLRRRIIADLSNLPEVHKQALRTERVRQIAYLSQAYEQLDDGRALDEFLSQSEIELFQGQTVSSWLKSVASCPSWSISRAGGISDARFKQDVCSPECRGRAKAATKKISLWRQERRRDWELSVPSKDLSVRIDNALVNCPRQ